MLEVQKYPSGLQICLPTVQKYNSKIPLTKFSTIGKNLTLISYFYHCRNILAKLNRNRNKFYFSFKIKSSKLL